MWLGARWLFSEEPRLSSLWQTVRTVDANVNIQPVGKQMLPALSIPHPLLAFYREGMESMLSPEGSRAGESLSRASTGLYRKPDLSPSLGQSGETGF